MNLNELKDKAGKVSDDMFGRERGPIGPVKKLRDEVDELLECFETGEDPGEEFADCLLILIDAYRKHYGDDVDMQKLIDDGSDKLDVVMKRVYKETDTPGVFQHVKGLDMNKVPIAHSEVFNHVVYDVIDSETWNKIKSYLWIKLPGCTIKCDEENNPTDVIDSGHVHARVTDDTTKEYIDLIF